jgi:hypothetical protein
VLKTLIISDVLGLLESDVGVKCGKSVVRHRFQVKSCVDPRNCCLAVGMTYGFFAEPTCWHGGGVGAWS